MIHLNHYCYSRTRIVFSLILMTLFVIFCITPLTAGEADSEKSSSDPLFSNFNMTGYVENESAIRLHPPQKFSKVQNLLQLELNADINAWGDFKLLTWALYDAVYDFYPQDYTDEFEDEYSSNFTADNAADQICREVYLSLFFDMLDIRLGKQQVVWGEAIGLRITDIVNPVDYREFILDDYIDSRIPLWTAKVTYYFGDFDLTGLWIPFFEPDQPALDGSEWMWTFNRITPPARVLNGLPSGPFIVPKAMCSKPVSSAIKRRRAARKICSK